jgi:aspartate-semialdehyde dehydrogenase
VTDRRRAAVLGAGGYIGQEFARMLADHPYFDPVLLVSGDRTGGRRLEEVWHLAEEVPAALRSQRLVAATPKAVAAEADIAFSALPGGVAVPVESALSRLGVAVFSNASDHRADPGRPLLIPEVNPEHLGILPRGSRSAPIITNPNCSATGLAIALKPIVRPLDPRTVHVATYQALSGAGFPGVASLSIADNVVPFIAGEEEKLARETPQLLGSPRGRRIVPAAITIHPQCARVGVREGHLEAVTVLARRRPTLAEITSAWRSFDPLAGLALPSAPHPPIALRAEADRPQPLRDRWAGEGRARGMQVVLGRVRWTPPTLRFFLLSHNAVRGGAGGSVLNAELAEAKGILGARPSRGR